MTPIVRTADDLVELVRARRKELGLTQEQLAGVVGVHRTFISFFESGRRNVSLDSALRVVQALGLDIELRPRGE
ncbi:MAG: helix-turn-helix transcriptional regulator [Solirubrobacterales bacterium]